METCKGPECDRRVRCVGLCNAHYTQHKLGKQLQPLSGQGRPYQPGEALYHGERSCRFVSSASPAFLMLAAFLKHHSDTQWVAEVADRCSRPSRRQIVFVIYDDDGSLGMLSRTAVSRNPRKPKGTHWYAQRVNAS